MDHGRILAVDTPAALVRGLDAPARITVAPGQLDLDAASAHRRRRRRDRGRRRASCSPPGARRPSLARLADADQLDGVRVQTGTLEDVFLDLTGREYRA